MSFSVVWCGSLIDFNVLFFCIFLILTVIWWKISFLPLLFRALNVFCSLVYFTWFRLGKFSSLICPTALSITIIADYALCSIPDFLDVLCLDFIYTYSVTDILISSTLSSRSDILSSILIPSSTWSILLTKLCTYFLCDLIVVTSIILMMHIFNISLSYSSFIYLIAGNWDNMNEIRIQEDWRRKHWLRKWSCCILPVPKMILTGWWSCIWINMTFIFLKFFKNFPQCFILQCLLDITSIFRIL